MEGSVAENTATEKEIEIELPDDVVFGREYIDTVTSYRGTCTGVLLRMHEDPQILLENPTESRWLPTGRVDNVENATTQDE